MMKELTMKTSKRPKKVEVKKPSKQPDPFAMTFKERLDGFLLSSKFKVAALKSQLQRKGEGKVKGKFSPSYLSQVFKGQKTPSPEFVVQLAKLMGADRSYPSGLSSRLRI